MLIKHGWHSLKRALVAWSTALLTLGLGLALVMIVAGSARADSGALGLMQAFEAARDNDPMFRGAQAERQAGLEFADIGRARVLPTISAVVSNNRNTATVTSSNGAVDNRGAYTGSSASLQLRHPLYDREAWASRDLGLARTAASEAAYRAREQDLIVRVFDAYTKALLAREEVSHLRTQLLGLDEQMRSNEQRFARGEGTRTDVLETTSKQALLRAQLIEMQDNEENARNALQAIVGRPVQRLASLKPEAAAAVPEAGPLEAWRLRAIASNGDIESLRQAVEVARQELRRIQSGHHPRLDLLLSTGRSVSDTTATFQQTSRTRTVGVQLSVPIYSGGGISAQARQAAAQLAKAEADLDAKLAELQVELHRQYTLQRSSGARILALQSAVDTSLVLIDATRKSVLGGERTNADVLDARERLSRAERDFAQARYQQLLAGLRLRGLAGVLQTDDLRAVATQFTAGP
ncbi:TolC family outer membrane protein [Hydrogenophaga sp.]|uniref:TolC family outer membrane protein n=1 Tax=Hydrogenophaga sp. TaxID=1904254 RepID=UPI00272F3FC0|nr:TolC family outer membrane protein [Hydrogenophaga sp.]MDP1684256.1 TolC family outer membrane protein [Hydrogenophaga sp.]